MCMGMLERLVPVAERNASRSIELISPTSSRRLARRRSRKWTSSRALRPARFLRGLPSSGGGCGITAGGRVSSWREDLACDFTRVEDFAMIGDFAMIWDFGTILPEWLFAPRLASATLL